MRRDSNGLRGGRGRAGKGGEHALRAHRPRHRAETGRAPSAARPFAFQRLRRAGKARQPRGEEDPAHGGRGETARRVAFPPRAPEPHRGVRHLAHFGYGQSGEYGGVRGRRAQEGALPQVPHQDGGGQQRFRVHERGADAQAHAHARGNGREFRHSARPHPH